MFAQSSPTILDEIITTIRTTIVDLIEALISFVPDLIIGLIVLLIGWIIARILSWGVRQVASRIGLDSIVEKSGLTGGLRRVNITQLPSILLSRIIYWIVFLNFLLEALQTMRFGSAIEPLQRFIVSLPNIVAALITLILGLMIAQFIGRTVSGALSGIGLEIHDTLGNITRGLIVCMVFIISLQQIGMDVDLLTQIFVSTLTIIIAGIALAFGLGGRSVTRNVLAGFYARELFEPGDQIEIDGQQGTLEGIGTINSEIKTMDGVLTVPNTRLTENSVKRLSV